MILFGDCEVYKNYFILLLKDFSSGKLWRWEVLNGEELGPHSKQDCVKLLKNNTVIGFNWENYDRHVLYAYLSGFETEEIHKVSSFIIDGDNLAPYKVAGHFGYREFRYKFIDIMNICPLKASLKIYAGRVNSDNLQDLPVDPNELITEEQADVMLDYCINDLKLTRDLMLSVKDQISLRVNITKTSRLHLVSKSDAQIAEALFRKELVEAGIEPIKGTTIKVDKHIQYDPPDWAKFETEELKELMVTLKDERFVVSQAGKVMLPPSVSKTLSIGDGKYKMGIGGLHSKEKNRKITRKAGEILTDADVTSFYPSIILKNEYRPERYGAEFSKIYNRIYSRRLEAKSKSK